MALAIVAGTLSMVAGVVFASVTVDSIHPLYRFGPEPRELRVVEVKPARPQPPAFTPIRWSGFAAPAPTRRDAYDDPALLDGPRPAPAPRQVKLPPPEPIAPRPALTPSAPVVEPLDLPPPITPAEIGEAR